jgi:hypothetical protein
MRNSCTKPTNLAIGISVVLLALAVSSQALATRAIHANARKSWGVTRLGDWNTFHDPGYHAAVNHLGRPSHVSNPQSTACKAKWHKLGLSIQFADFAGGSNCGDSSAQKARIQGRHARRAWRTTRGLRIGDSAKRLHDLYPRAWKHGASFWLVYQRYNPISNGPHAIVKARMKHHHVKKFGLWIGGAGD